MKRGSADATTESTTASSRETVDDGLVALVEQGLRTKRRNATVLLANAGVTVALVFLLAEGALR